jgi:hypothetical protein
MWRLAIMDPITFCLQLAAYSLLLLSILVTFGDEMRKQTKNVLNWLGKNLSGGRKRTSKSRSFASLCVSFVITYGKDLAWISKWIGRRKGAAPMGSMYTILGCTVIMLLASLAIPFDHASVTNQVKTTGRLYLPHVEEELDNYHFYAEPDGEPAKRMMLVFCKDRGFKPQFDEGETLTWIRYRAWDDCLEFMAGDCERDSQFNCTRR